MTRYWKSCGPLLGSLRWIRRAARFVAHRMATAVWRTSLARLGRGSLIEWGVRIETPRLVEIGERCLLTQGAVVASETASGRLVLSDDVQINRAAHLDHSGGLFIGEGALISEEAMVYTHTHGRDPHSAPTGVPLRIESRAWIGARAIILPGVGRIGEGAVVGAGAVVAREVADQSVVVGNPARVVASVPQMLPLAVRKAS